MGAAGMVLVDPLFQRVLVQEARERGLVVVYDEIATGLHRLGPQSAAALLQVKPASHRSMGHSVTHGPTDCRSVPPIETGGALAAVPGCCSAL